MKIRFIRALPQIDHVVPAGTVLDAPQGFAHKMVRQKFAVFVDKETPGTGTEWVSGQEKAVPSVNPIEEAMKKAHAAVSGTAAPAPHRHADGPNGADPEDGEEAEPVPAAGGPEDEEDEDSSEEDEADGYEPDAPSSDTESPAMDMTAPELKTDRTGAHETVTGTRPDHESAPVPARPAAGAQKKPVRKAKNSAK